MPCFVSTDWRANVGAIKATTKSTGMRLMRCHVQARIHRCSNQSPLRAWVSRGNHRREASTHFALRHDRVVRVIAFGIGERSRPPCLVMERMQGTLYGFIGTNPSPLDLGASLSYIIDICEVSLHPWVVVDSNTREMYAVISQLSS